MFRSLAVLVAALFLVVSNALADEWVAPPVPIAEDSSIAPKLDALLEQKRQELHIPGVSFVVVRDGKIVYMRAFGQRDVERNLPATVDTLFPIGSCTKAFTATEVAISVDRGMMSLSDHPRKFLTYFKMKDPEADAKVTLRDMLSHRTGLKAYADLISVGRPNAVTREQYLRATIGATPVAPFGTKFQYSNAMITAAGEVVAKAHKTTWEQATTGLILRPLGMRNSTSTVIEAMQKPDHAVGYDFKNGKFTPAAQPTSLVLLAPAGSVTSSAREMAQWLAMLSGKGEIAGHRFVSPEMFTELTTPKTPMNAKLSYALGWALYDWNGLKVVEHNGGSSGISALTSFIPERGLGFVFLANVGPNDMTRITAAAQLVYPILTGMQSPPPSPPPPPPPQAAPEPPKPANLPAADVLVKQMVGAAGGEAALKRHTSYLMEGTKTYDNHGIEATFTVRAAAPYMVGAVERWSASGRTFAFVRAYFDGVHGGQETDFNQDEVFDEKGVAAAKRDNDMHALLHLSQLYEKIEVTGEGEVENEPVWRLSLTADGDTSTWSVSKKSALVLARESGSRNTVYKDYRKIDGEMVSFHQVTNDPLGLSQSRVRSIRYNVPIDKAAFAPKIAR
jgi:CubicO group peptidase (beta-lactamase class C family)